jgi:hypothetical protein
MMKAAAFCCVLSACGAKEDPAENEVVIEWRDGETTLLANGSNLVCSQDRLLMTIGGEVTTVREAVAIDVLVLVDGEVADVFPSVAIEDYVSNDVELSASFHEEYSPPPGDHSTQFCLEKRIDPLIMVSEPSSEGECLPLIEYDYDCSLFDDIDPSIRAERRPEANEYGWYKGPVTVSFVCEDAGSGIAECSDSVLLSEEGGAWEIEGTATDYADNTETMVSSPVRIDLTPPSITFTGAREYLVDETIVVSCSIRDDLSGVLEGLCSGTSVEAYMLDLGAYPVSASAVDLAGNEIQADAQYSVRATAGSVCNVVRRFVSDQGVLVSLCSKLRNAEAAFSVGDLELGESELAAFDEQVDAEEGLAVPAEHAGTLVRLSLGLRP